jgi:peptidoglycan L-alanyl-D-glutamate endopeptidase CwlK
MDNVTAQRIALLHPKVRNEAAALINEANALLTTHSQIRVVQGLRTFAEQDALFAKRPRVTKAKGGQSLHNYGVAVDFCLIIDGKEVSWDLKKDWDGDKIADWMEVVGVFRRAGWEWGGTWKFTDNPHFQKTMNNTWQQLLSKWNSGDTFVDTNGQKYVNI